VRHRADQRLTVLEFNRFVFAGREQQLHREPHYFGNLPSITGYFSSSRASRKPIVFCAASLPRNVLLAVTASVGSAHERPLAMFVPQPSDAFAPTPQLSTQTRTLPAPSEPWLPPATRSNSLALSSR